MSKCPEWIGPRPEVCCARFKKYLVLQPWQTSMQIDFRFERVYVIKEGYSLLLKSGELLPIAIVHTTDKVLIGPVDFDGDYSNDAKQFKAALAERAKE